MSTSIMPSGRRAGATWVAATGAFLLLAGAAVFVAVRWEQIPDLAKFGLLVALTAACVVGGRRLSAAAPATGDVLVHVGALLVPIDVAAAALRLHLGWRGLLLAEGVVGSVVLGGLALTSGSVVVSWAAIAAGGVLAAGVAGVTPIPAAAVLVAFAIVAELGFSKTVAPVRQRVASQAALAWAVVVGLSPALVSVARDVVARSGRRLGMGTLAELGVAGPGRGWTALVAGSLAAALLARRARAAGDTRLGGLALVCAGVSAISALSAAQVSPGMHVIAAAGAFLLVELAALVLRTDRFWRRPFAALAEMAEAVAALAGLPVALAIVVAPLVLRGSGDANPAGAVAVGIAALGWLAADFRRVERRDGPAFWALWGGSGWSGGTAGLALYATAAGVATGSGMTAAALALAIAGLAVAAGRPQASQVAGLAGLWSIAVAGTPAAALVASLVGSTILAVHVVRTARNGDGDGEPSEGLAALAVVTALAGAWAGGSLLGSATLPAVAALCWGLALAMDVGDRRAGDIARFGLAAPALLAMQVGRMTGEAAVTLAVVVTALAVEAARQRRPAVGSWAAVAAQLLLLKLGAAAGLARPDRGPALCVAAIAWAGMAAVVDSDWRRPFVTAATAGLAIGLVVAAGDPVVLSESLLVAGAVGIGAGLAARSSPLANAGGLFVTAGLAGLLSYGGVSAPEPYLAPVVTQLLVVGALARRRRGVGSWTAYGPAIALAGGSSLFDRMAGGAGWHAVVAGAVGLLAVAAGGWFRLAGPLLLGTALLVAVTVWESLGALAGIPTWTWLCVGGAVLLSVGVALERTDHSPMEAGRRLVDVVAERFA